MSPEALEADLRRAGWQSIVVERVADRHLVRARQGRRGLAGKLEPGAPGCPGGMHVDLREVTLPDGEGSRFAGPRGPREARPPTR